jgi:competence protein ComEA
MEEISRPQLALYAVIAVVIGLIGARFLAHGGGSSSTASGAAATAGTGSGSGRAETRAISVGASAGQPSVVDVTGAVRRPGVFRLRAGARVQDAVRRAGGVTPHADLSAVNLAAKVSDGAQILVPERGQATAVGPSGGATSAATPAQPVNLNTATAEQLDALDGVGPSTAQKIVLYRQQHGGFGSVTELDRIPGIGAKKVAALRLKVRV